MEPHMVVPLIRLENNIWGYHPEADNNETTLKEIQIITPTSDEPKFGYVLAQGVAQILVAKNIKQKAELQEDFSIELTNTLPSTMGRWSVSLLRHDSWIDQIMDAIPAAKTIRDKKIVELAVAPENKITSFFSSRPCLLYAGTQESANIQFPNKELPQNNQSLFGMAPFSDPFTRFSAAVLQTLDPRFVSERKIYTSFRFVLSENGQSLAIQEIPNRGPTEQEIQENIRTISWYRQYIIEEFGEKKLQFVDAVYGFSLTDMIQKGLPLAPDLVFKINIGMNKIDLSDVKELFTNLLASGTSEKGPDALFPRYQLRKFSEYLKIARSPTMQEIASLAAPLSGYTDVQDLPANLFNYVADFVLFSEKERERAYTGRKIHLWAISGTVTLGDPNVYNPSSDLFDVLQSFPQFEKTDDWENYCELLTHIIVKKALYDPLEQNRWNVGLMIAGPKDAAGLARWYYIESFCDDNAGNVNYLLLPACKNYLLETGDRAPMIKAYRSTSSAQNCIDWAESIAADLNPFGSPSTLIPQNSFLYEKPYFDERTIPVWVGYLLAAAKVKNQDMAKEKANLNSPVGE
jgi:hypothetical protein